jgi:hypothetical protein
MPRSKEGDAMSTPIPTYLVNEVKGSGMVKKSPMDGSVRVTGFTCCCGVYTGLPTVKRQNLMAFNCGFCNRHWRLTCDD